MGAADRGAYIDQSQSLNIHMVDATTAKLSSMHFHGWQLGLKTGMYYLRTKAAADAIKFTVDVESVRRATSQGQITKGMSVLQQSMQATISELQDTRDTSTEALLYFELRALALVLGVKSTLEQVLHSDVISKPSMAWVVATLIVELFRSGSGEGLCNPSVEERLNYSSSFHRKECQELQDTIQLALG